MTIQDPQQPAQACIIWMHGLGANGADMAGVAKQLSINVPIRHVFLDAPVRPVTLNNRMPMRAWYDIIGIKLTDREDREGLMQSEALIRQAIDHQIAHGFKPQQIFLAGFSQGSAMALFTGLRSNLALGGIVALSGYLPLAADCEPKSTTCALPIFIGGGRFDPVVLPDWTKQSFDWLKARGFTHLAWHQYSIEHSICMEEIRDIGHWLSSIISTIHAHGVK